MSNQIAKQDTVMTKRGLIFSDFNELMSFAKIAAASEYGGHGKKKPEDIAMAIQLGAEVGLPPIFSYINIDVIHGKPAMRSVAMHALVEASGKLERISESFEGEGDNYKAICTVKRFGREPKTVTFSMADAKKARLTLKGGGWNDYAGRMLRARALSFALRDVFPDVLMGLSHSIEELQEPQVVRVIKGKIRSGYKNAKEEIIDNETIPETYETIEVINQETGEITEEPKTKEYFIDMGKEIVTKIKLANSIESLDDVAVEYDSVINDMKDKFPKMHERVMTNFFERKSALAQQVPDLPQGFDYNQPPHYEAVP